MDDVSAEAAGGASSVRRFAWIGVLLFGVIAYVVVLRVMIYTDNPIYFPTLLLIGSITVPVSTVAFAVGGGRSIPVSASMVVFTAIVGGLVGTVAAGLLEYDALRNLGVVSMILVAVIEESAKLAVPLLIYLYGRTTDPRAGVIIGIAAGMGFATMETMGYGFQVLLAAQSITAVDQTLLLRALLSPASHIAWTGMTVAMLWRIRSAPNQAKAIGVFLLTFLIAIGLHATWDASTSTPVHIALAVVGYAFLMLFVHFAHRTPKTPKTIAEMVGNPVT
jgi:RsiW-degrading membrane proteinase PrsW (M82 family)